MELRDALRTTGSVRRFRDQPVDDEVLYAVLDDARFAPSGGNRQSWGVIVVKDPVRRREVAKSYLDAWHDYVAHLLAGVTPFSPLASDEDRLAAASQRGAAESRSVADGFAETLATVPVTLVVTADLSTLAATDRDLDRYHLVGGASIYPFVWSLLLGAHERGLGGVMTTVATRNEPRLQEILDLPATTAVAAIVALGYPESRSTKLTRRPVEAFTTIDTFHGVPFRP
ncbi:MAG: dehydrogenase [Acidimicrobiaceae bacterium]|nr:dehydrogenase [Acidimicrobiaceae bacterium]